MGKRHLPWQQSYASEGLVDAQCREGLDDTQRAAYDKLREEVDTWDIPSELDGWADEACLCRYLRARSWDVAKAAKMLSETVKWRSETRPDRITYDEVKGQAEALSNYTFGYDSAGHPIVYMRVSRDPPGTAEEKLQFIIYNLEECMRLMAANSTIFPGVERLIYIVDLKGFTMANSRRDSAVGGQWTSILSNHCPERLHKAYLLNYPGVFRAFWTLLKPMLDPVTRAKVTWVSASTAEQRRDFFQSEGFNMDWFEMDYGGNLPGLQHVNLLASPSHRSFWQIVPAWSSPYAWTALAAALTVYLSAYYLPPASPRESVDQLETVESDEYTEFEDVIRVDSVMSRRAGQRGEDTPVAPPTPEPPPLTIKVMAPDHTVRQVPVDADTIALDVLQKGIPYTMGLKQSLRLRLYYNNRQLEPTERMFGIARGGDHVLSLREPDTRAMCCSVM